MTDTDQDTDTNKTFGTVDIGGEIYVLHTNKSINSTYRSLQDFKRTFGQDSETKELLLKHLPLKATGYDYDDFKFDGTEDEKAAFMRIIKGRIAQLDDSINTLTSSGRLTLNKMPLKRYADNLRRLEQSLKRSSSHTPVEQSANCKKDIEYTKELKEKDDKVFELILRMSWFLLHPEKVPKDIQCDWAKLVKRMDGRRLHDVIDAVTKKKSSNSANAGNRLSKSVNYFKRIKYDTLKHTTSLKNLEKEAVTMITKIDPADAMKEHINSLLDVLSMKRYLNSSKMLTEHNVTSIKNQLIENPMAIEENSIIYSTVPNSSQTGGSPPMAAAAPAASKAPKKVAGTPIATQTPSPSTKDRGTSAPRPTTVNIGTSTTENTQVTEQKKIDKDITRYLQNSMAPLYDHFKKMYDPVYGFLKNNIDGMRKNDTLKKSLTYIFPDLLRLLHIVNNLPLLSLDPTKNTDEIPTVFQITNVKPSILEFIRAHMKFTVEEHTKIQKANTKKGNNFINEIHALPQVTLKEVRAKEDSTTANPTYIQFFVVDGNIKLHDNKNTFAEKSGVGTEADNFNNLYKATTDFFTVRDLYIVTTNNATAEIPMDIKEIDYSTVDHAQENHVVIKPLEDNYFTKEKSKLNNITMNQLVEIDKNAIFNSTELVINILLLFNDKMPTKEK